MEQNRVAVILLLLAVMAGPVAADPCQEIYEVPTGPISNWIGLHTSGVSFGQGQSFLLSCGSRLETVSFQLSWGVDYPPVRSLVVGDVLSVAVLTDAGFEVARTDWTVDENSASKFVAFDFIPQNLLLPPGAYLAVCWTDAPACGGFDRTDDDVAGGSWMQSLTPNDPTSWVDQAGESVHRIVLDSNVTPLEDASWGTVKLRFR